MGICIYLCHALTLVFLVSFIILVRSGCDEGDICVFVLFLYVYGLVSSLGGFMAMVA